MTTQTDTLKQTESATQQADQPIPQPIAQICKLDKDAPVKVLGRSALLATGIALDHSAATLEFTLVGSGDAWLTGKASKDIYFTVFIDNIRQEKRVLFTVGTNEMKIASNLSDGTHTVRVVRQTEEKYGTFDAQFIRFSHGMFGEKPQEKPIYIEFVGDSITCGSGALHHFLTSDDALTYRTEATNVCIGEGGEPVIEEDASCSYAYHCAQMLDADYSLISYSGIGVARTWGGESSILMPTYYGYLAQQRLGSHAFDFDSARKPDMVVINLGTNDGFLVNNSAFSGAMSKIEYTLAVQDFITQIRIQWNDPDLKIVWATGLMGKALSDWTKEAIESMDDENVYHFTGMTEGRDGHNGHPTWQQQTVGASQLTAFLKQLGRR